MGSGVGQCESGVRVGPLTAPCGLQCLALGVTLCHHQAAGMKQRPSGASCELQVFAFHMLLGTPGLLYVALEVSKPLRLRLDRVAEATGWVVVEGGGGDRWLS